MTLCLCYYVDHEHNNKRPSSKENIKIKSQSGDHYIFDKYKDIDTRLHTTLLQDPIDWWYFEISDLQNQVPPQHVEACQ